jgi:hypothetical protein
MSQEQVKRSLSEEEIKAVFITGEWLGFDPPSIIDMDVVEQVIGYSNAIEMKVTKENVIEAIHILVQIGVDLGHVII